MKTADRDARIRILTVANAAEHYRVRPSTVRAWIRARHLSAYRIGREYRLTWDASLAALFPRRMNDSGPLQSRPSRQASPLNATEAAMGAVIPTICARCRRRFHETCPPSFSA